MLAIPSLIFALAIMAVAGARADQPADRARLDQLVLHCRIARASTLSLKSQGYVQAARVLGYGDLRIMITQLLPNMVRPHHRDRHAGHGRRGIGRSRIVVPWPRNPPTLSKLGQYAVGGPRPDHDGAVVVGFPPASPSS